MSPDERFFEKALQLPKEFRALLAEKLLKSLEDASDAGPLERDRTYSVATPVFEPGAADALLDELRAASRG
jgi:hypothetical protein